MHGEKFNFSSLYRLRNKPREGQSKAAQQAHVIVAPNPNASSGPCRFWLHVQRLCKQMTSKRTEAGLPQVPKNHGQVSIPVWKYARQWVRGRLLAARIWVWLSQALLQLSFFPLYINPLAPDPRLLVEFSRPASWVTSKRRKQHLAPFFPLGHLYVCPP